MIVAISAVSIVPIAPMVVTVAPSVVSISPVTIAISPVIIAISPSPVVAIADDIDRVSVDRNVAVAGGIVAVRRITGAEEADRRELTIVVGQADQSDRGGREADISPFVAVVVVRHRGGRRRDQHRAKADACEGGKEVSFHFEFSFRRPSGEIRRPLQALTKGEPPGFSDFRFYRGRRP